MRAAHSTTVDPSVRAQLEVARSLLSFNADTRLARELDDLLAGGESALALDVLAEVAQTLPAPERFWSLLIESAEAMGLVARAQPLRWRRIEARHGFLRASLHVLGTVAGGTVTSGFRACWHIGGGSEEDKPLADGAITIEDAPSIGPGETRGIRLHPLIPTLWRRVRTMQELAMFHGRDILGRAVILEVVPPFAERR